jgi:hypothetical protein
LTECSQLVEGEHITLRHLFMYVGSLLDLTLQR